LLTVNDDLIQSRRLDEGESKESGDGDADEREEK